ncbi:MAG: type II toxin-antitoxin system VapC family toxin [Deltaproteobacteria bacterium]|nr:type II toxin-antitoxin system VapC family toxin [Myxococcales bacterium]MDP3215063.1 type II toxin-antitoxin system VapC family toxin [Deltaproteobacteria bacterium]
MNPIDPALLPASVLLDSNVALRGFGAYPDDKRSPICVAFVEACIRNQKLLLIAAPTLAEILRGGNTRAIPRVDSVEIVEFGPIEARLLGEDFPQETLSRLADQEGVSLTYYKYDALIVACAKANKVNCFVSYDRKAKTLAATVGIRVAEPAEFIAKQGTLPLPEAQAPRQLPRS